MNSRHRSSDDAATETIIDLDRQYTHSVSMLLAESFKNDPSFRSIYRSQKSQTRWLTPHFASVAKLAINCGTVKGVAERLFSYREADAANLVGVALWYFACQRFPPPWYRTIVPTLPLVPLILEPWTYGRLERAWRLSLSLLPKKRKYAYLAAVCVRAEYRGKGIGTKLIQDGLRRAAQDHSLVFLHCLSGLIPYYERLGFSIVAEATLDGLEDTMYGMQYEL